MYQVFNWAIFEPSIASESPDENPQFIFEPVAAEPMVFFFVKSTNMFDIYLSCIC